MKIACIPAYNEEKILPHVIQKVLPYVDKVIVFDDGSNDQTSIVAEKNGAQVISNKINQGYGAAIISFFELARQNNADVMITLDGDGQHDPSQIPQLIDELSKKNVDVVIGSRFVGKNSKTSRYRKAGIKIISSTSNLGTKFKVKDSQSGFRAYSKKAINLIHPTEKGMSVSTEILQKISNNGLKVSEVPVMISYDENSSKQSSVPHGVQVLINTLKYISVKHPIPFFGFPGIVLLVVGFIVGYYFLENYLSTNDLFLGSLFGSIILVLLGSILCATSIILFSMATLMREKQ